METSVPIRGNERFLTKKRAFPNVGTGVSLGRKRRLPLIRVANSFKFATRSLLSFIQAPIS